MTTVTIYHGPLDQAVFLIDQSSLPGIRRELHRFTNAGRFETDLTGEDAAEEAFDLTNNPTREDERQEKYGRMRSVSVGDVVDVDGVKYVCMSFGWEMV